MIKKENTKGPILGAEVESFYREIEDIYGKLKESFNEFSKFQSIINNQKTAYSSKDLVTGQKPESLVRQSLIDPILKFLKLKWINETSLTTPSGTRVPDYSIYTIDISKPVLYIEAEAFNVNLYEKELSGHKVGLGQVKEWLYSRFSKSNHGIATNGFFWVLVTLEPEDSSLREVLTLDLRPFFKYLLTNDSLNNGDFGNTVKDFLNLKADRITEFLNDQVLLLENEKEQVSNSFYVKYMRYVLGRDSKGELLHDRSLLNSIIVPDDVSESKRELFAVITMNRLIFIYFLEDRSLVPGNILTGLYQTYREAKPPDNFYNTYLKPLFYNVFNTNKENRPDYVKKNDLYSSIPYLNGGLFNYIIEEENSYSVRDEGIDLILNSLFSGVSIGLSNDANVRPEILGFIFEKTINYISGKGTNAQKMEGAYYTPEDVVQFIVRNTLDRKIFSAMRDGLISAGWKDRDLAGLNTLEDVLKSVKPNEKLVASMMGRIDQLKVIDPSCGSGHFLTVVLNELARVESSLLMIIGSSVDYYGIKRKILTNNIYGVDIDEIGVEITKLRLWLSIISEADPSDKEHIESLPNVDYNIIKGNTLVGHLSENIANGLFPVQFDQLFYNDLKNIENILGKDGSEIREKLQSGQPSSCIEAFSLFNMKYRSLSGKRALAVRHIMKRVRNNVYEVLGQAFATYLASFSSNSRYQIQDLIPKLALSDPLHWDIDFSEITKKNGFDVVLGNPPYVEDNALNISKMDLLVLKAERKAASNKGHAPLIYKTKDCGNTHAYFIERSLNLLKRDGILGFIVPVSLVSTDRMAPVREVIMSSSQSVEYYNFDDRPGKIFSGIEHCRSTIVIGEKGNGVNEVTTSRYHRWYSKNRPELFDDLKTVKYGIPDRRAIIPKIGTEYELHILEKMKEQAEGKTLGDFLKGEGTKVWYHNAPQYWVHSHYDKYVPKAEYYSEYTRDDKSGEIKLIGSPYETKITDHYKSIEFDANIAAAVAAILNSSLFYWWFVIWSDGRDLLSDHILSLPFDPEKLNRELLESLKRKCLELMDDYELNSNIKLNIRKGGYAIKIREIIPKKCYERILEIDEIIAKIYDFDSEEANFFKNFDIDFRLGRVQLHNDEQRNTELS
ncbi:MAG: Eco57I restriction-modification methylase domain-containing protein [Thermoplasmataceae archaeon]